MKHFILLIICLISVYFAWVMTPYTKKRKATRFFHQHRAPVGTLLLVAFLLLCAAFYFPATSFF